MEKGLLLSKLGLPLTYANMLCECFVITIKDNKLYTKQR